MHKVILFLFLLTIPNLIFSKENRNLGVELYYTGFSPIRKLGNIRTDTTNTGINLKFFKVLNMFYEQVNCDLNHNTVNLYVKGKNFGGSSQLNINNKTKITFGYEKEIHKMLQFSIGNYKFLPINAKTNNLIFESNYNINDSANLTFGVSRKKGDFELYNHELLSNEIFINLKKRIKNKFIITPSFRLEKAYIIFAPEKIKKRHFSKNIKFSLKSEYMINKDIFITCTGGINSKGVGMQNNLYEGIGITSSFRYQYFKYDQNFQSQYQKLKKYMEDKTGYLYLGIEFKL